jgi:sec-independent protein translocase protein TatA
MPMGGTELLIILAIILLFFGAKRVPQLGRSLGQSIREFRKGVSEDPDRKEDRAQQLHDEDREKPPLNGSVAGSGAIRTEAKASRVEQDL